MEEILNLQNLEGNIFFQGLADLNSFKDYFTPTTEYSPIESNKQSNTFIPTQIDYSSNQLNRFSDLNPNSINLTQSESILFSNYPFINIENPNPIRFFQAQSQLNIPNNFPEAINFNKSSISISK